MDDHVSKVMDARLADLLARWRDVALPVDDPAAAFAAHADYLLVMNDDAGQIRYGHYGRAFAQRFGADLTGRVIDMLPTEIMPADRRGMLAFEYAFVLHAQRPLWRSYTARFDSGDAETWQRLVLPLGPGRLVVGAYPCLPQAAPEVATAEGLLRFLIDRVPVVIGCHGEVEDLALSLQTFGSTQQHMAELEILASRDPLTGVSNLRHFHHMAGLEFEHSRRMGRPFSILALDIDHFKRINDNWGHAIGDNALQAFAAACRAALRGPDIIGRCGGEEFAVGLPNTGIDGALVIAERLRVHVEELRIELPQAQPLSFTVSIGVTTWEPTSPATVTVPDLLARADEALYISKREGRNRVTMAR